MKQRSFAPTMPLPEFQAKRNESQNPAILPPEQQGSPDIQPTIGRSLISAPVDLIDENPLAPRFIYTPEMVADRADALRKQGQHDPIHLVPNPDVSGRFIIADGWTRVLACKIHHVLDVLLAEVHHDMTLQQAAWFGYEQNEEREQHCDIDRAQFYEKLITAGQSQAEIAERAKLTKPMFTYYRAYAKLPEDVLDVVRQNPKKFSSIIAYNLSRLSEKCGARRTVALALKFAEEDRPVRWLINQVQSHINPTEHKAATPLKHIRYANGYYKQRDNDFEISIAVPHERREEFATAIEQLLDTVAVHAKSAQEGEQ